MRGSRILFLIFMVMMLMLSACQPLAVQTEPPGAAPAIESAEDKIQNAMSAAPPAIAEEATIMDWPADWPGNWPDEPAGDLVELRAGNNGWTCMPARPDTPTNDPRCLNADMLAWQTAMMAKTEPEVTGVGIAYMLQGGSSANRSDPFILEPPAGQEWSVGPAHLMVYIPGGEEYLSAFHTTPGPAPWLMNEGTPYAHLMIGIPPQPESVDVGDKIQNAMSAAPPAIAEEATIMDWPADWPGNWPDEPAGELIELRAGNNGWTCMPARPDTPTNDPRCLNADMLAWQTATMAKLEPEVTGVGIAYMLQGGSSANRSDPFVLEPPAGQEWSIGPAHLMVYIPGAEEYLSAFHTTPGPAPWLMNEGTPYAHLMIGIPPQPESADPESTEVEDKIQNAMSAAPPSIAAAAAIMDWPTEENSDFAELRAGTNGWSCFPDDPATPANDPQCLDAQWLEWLHAYFEGREPEITTWGWAYMLQGGSSASDSDPSLVEPPAGEEWLVGGPHVMLIGPESFDASLYATSRDSGEPYIMWAGTPYEHFMIPVQADIPAATDDPVANALSAAPDNIAAEAAVLDWPSAENAEFAELRAGTNGWSCFPDDPATPGNDPQCFDAQWLEWLTAFFEGRAPVITAVGFSYMLQGGSSASDADPSLMEPPTGEEWLVGPPHVMMVAPGAFDASAHPTHRASGEPYIMWAGTPYEHFMAPSQLDGE